MIVHCSAWCIASFLCESASVTPYPPVQLVSEVHENLESPHLQKSMTRKRSVNIMSTIQSDLLWISWSYKQKATDHVWKPDQPQQTGLQDVVVWLRLADSKTMFQTTNRSGSHGVCYIDALSNSSDSFCKISSVYPLICLCKDCYAFEAKVCGFRSDEAHRCPATWSSDYNFKTKRFNKKHQHSCLGQITKHHHA